MPDDKPWTPADLGSKLLHWETAKDGLLFTKGRPATAAEKLKHAHRKWLAGYRTVRTASGIAVMRRARSVRAPR